MKIWEYLVRLCPKATKKIKFPVAKMANNVKDEEDIDKKMMVK